MNKTQGTEPSNAPETEVKETKPVEQVVQPAPPPRPKTIERQGVQTEPYTRRLPQIRGGVCEFCGVLDRNMPSHLQYQLCPHFRGLGEMRCSYCPESKDPADVIGQAVVNVAEHPNNPDQLVVWCNSYNCSRKHEQRFKVSR